MRVWSYHLRADGGGGGRRGGGHTQCNFVCVECTIISADSFCFLISLKVFLLYGTNPSFTILFGSSAHIIKSPHV